NLTSAACVSCVFFYFYRDHRALHSFPTRRSSDLNFSVKLKHLQFDTFRGPLDARVLFALNFDGDVDEMKIEGVADFKRIKSKPRSEEHTSELQSRFDLVCRLLLEKKK